MTIFSKNVVLAGQLDYYCLICAERFKNEEETLEHIVDTQHKNKLQACGYFHKFKEHFIRKVGSVYFCELCSQTFPTATKVALHIDDQFHVKEKIKTLQSRIIRVNNDIVAFDQFLITDEAWNGFIEDTCVLCNSEYDDGTAHKADSNHILNLMKSKVILDDVIAAVYRSIDEKSNHCLTCNVIFGEDPIYHFKTSEHKSASKIYDKNCNNRTNDISNDVNGTQNILGKEKNTKADHPVKRDNGEKAVKKEVGKKNKNDKSKQSADQSKKYTAVELDNIACKNLGAKNYIIDIPNGKICILCDRALNEPPEMHVNGRHHQILLNMHKERIENDSINSNNDPSNDNKSNLFECVEKFQNSNVNIDLISETAVCKKCSQNIEYNTEAIEKHIEGHKKTNKKTTAKVTPLASGMKSNGNEKTTLYTRPVVQAASASKEKRHAQPGNSAKEVEAYAKEHGLTHNRADNSFYCNLCSRRLPTTLEDLTKHVNSNNHKENVAKKSLKKQIVSRPPLKMKLTEFIDSLEITETMIGIFMVLNDKYWINDCDFFLIAKLNHKIFCQVCDIDLIPENVLEHIASEIHSDKVQKGLVIASLDDEFVREIKLDVYHCGYCNQVEHDWEDTLEHLATQEHKTKKLEAEQFLRNHKPNPYRRICPKDLGKASGRLMFDCFMEQHMRRHM